MSLSKLSPTIVAFVQATNAQDATALNALFAADAILQCAGKSLFGPEIVDWNRDRYLAPGVSIHPINVFRRGNHTVLTVMAYADITFVNVDMPAHVDLSFETRDGAIVRLGIAATNMIPLPGAVSSFVHAMNTFDLEALAAVFRSDSMVNDQLKEFWGKPAILAWASDEIVKDRMTMHVTEVIEHLDHIFVRANVDGDFDKRGLPDPLNLTFSFFLTEGRIGQLLILNNRPAD